MTAKEAEDYIYSSYMRASRFQDYGAADAKKRCPELSRRIIRSLSGTPACVVTGSKGKGSAACMLASILDRRLKTGLMTSPHIIDFRERFRAGGKMIPEDAFARAVESVRPAFDRIEADLPPEKCISPMGIQTAAALSWFREEGTGFNVLECGKGARYDDVKNARHAYALINSIFLEHTRELGGTLREIAADKAHVMDGEQKKVYCAAQDPEALDEILGRAREYGTDVLLYGRDFTAESIRFTKTGMCFDLVLPGGRFKDLRVPLLGEHQAKNAALSAALAEDVLGGLSEMELREALSGISWPGRQEILSEKPFVLLDACINRVSARSTAETLRRLGFSHLTAVIGIPDDKDFEGVAAEMADVSDRIILTRSGNPHYVFTRRQQERLREKGIPAAWTDSTEKALLLALSGGGPAAVLGTTSVVSEVKLLEEKGFFTKRA